MCISTISSRWNSRHYRSFFVSFWISIFPSCRSLSNVQETGVEKSSQVFFQTGLNSDYAKLQMGIQVESTVQVNTTRWKWVVTLVNSGSQIYAVFLNSGKIRWSDLKHVVAHSRNEALQSKAETSCFSICKHLGIYMECTCPYPYL